VQMVFRTLWLSMRSGQGPRMSMWDTSRLSFRVRLRDLDALRHMTNSAYLAYADLGRMDLVIRSGFWNQIRRNHIISVVANQTVTYRRSLRLGDRFQLETRVAGVDDIAAYFEQRFVAGGVTYAEAMVRHRFIRPGEGTVPIDELVHLVDPKPADRVVPPWVRDWTAGVTATAGDAGS
jgi:YbgC/YbaW family acyl-CoA thioester hydrolase